MQVFAKLFNVLHDVEFMALDLADGVGPLDGWGGFDDADVEFFGCSGFEFFLDFGFTVRQGDFEVVSGSLIGAV